MPKIAPEAIPIDLLAKAFLEATVERPGTDEESVYAILAEVHRRGPDAQRAFSEELASPSHQAALKDIYIDKRLEYIVPTILYEEMSGAELSRAQDIWDKGAPTYSDGALDFVIQGAVNAFSDIGELFYEYPIPATLVTAGMIGLVAMGLVFEIPAVMIGASVVAGGILLYDIGSAAYHAAMAYGEQDRAERAGHLEGIGRGTAGAAMSAGALGPAMKPAARGLRFVRAAREVDLSVGGERTGLSAAILRWLSPSRQTVEETAEAAVAYVARVAKTDEAQQGMLLRVLEIEGATSQKPVLNQVQIASLRHAAASDALKHGARREALALLDRAGALDIRPGSADIAILEEILVGKTRKLAMVDQGAASLYEAAASILQRSDSPEAVAILKESYWLSISDRFRGAMWTDRFRWALSDQLGYLRRNDPLAGIQQQIYKLAAQVADESMAAGSPKAVLTRETETLYLTLRAQPNFEVAAEDLLKQPIPDNIRWALTQFKSMMP